MDKEITDTLNKFHKLNIVKKYKIIVQNKDTLNKFLKADLKNYMEYIHERFPNLFDKNIVNQIMKKKKETIIDIINYYLQLRNLKMKYDLNIKGTSLTDLINVYVQKDVSKSNK